MPPSSVLPPSVAPARPISHWTRLRPGAVPRILLLVAALVWPAGVRGQDSVITLPDARDRMIQAQGLFVQGLTRSFLGDDAGAIERFERAAELAPEAPAIQSALATAFARRGDEPRAVPYARRAFDLDSSRAEYAIELADLLARTGDAPGAVALLDRRAASYPDEWLTLVERARLLRTLEQRTRAVDAFRALHERWVLPDELLEESIALESALGNVPEALALLDELSARRPFDATLARRQGETLVRLGRPDDAVLAFERAVAIDPLDTDARASLQALRGPSSGRVPSPLDFAQALMSEGRASEAADRLADLLDGDPSRLDAWQALVIARRNSGDPVAALDAAAEARLFFPGDVELALQAGIAALEALLPEEAREAFEAARGLSEEAASAVPPAQPNRDAEPNRTGWTTADQADVVIGAGLAAAGMLVADRPIISTFVQAVSSLRSAGIDEQSPAGFAFADLLVRTSARPADAAIELETRIASHPRSPVLFVVLGDRVAADGDMARARVFWEAARAIVPSSPVVRGRLGLK